jgi:hypothetical protein
MLRDYADCAETVQEWFDAVADPRERVRAFAKQLEQDFKEDCCRPARRKDAGLVELLIAAAILRVDFVAIARRLIRRLGPRSARPAWELAGMAPSVN